ncbi:MAG TPA: hypothetical protein ENJ00_08265 [Phycisphaerales bacterium]|nr:hypothetical protein [Phycisphaerales bacterium]
MIDSLFNDGGIWFSVPAIIGTLYFFVQIVLGGIGGDAGLDVDVDLDFDGDIGAGDAPGVEFGILSMQTLSAFFMGSGWMGFASLRLLDVGMTGAVIIALASGLFFGWMIMRIMRSMLRLQNSGNVSIADTIGLRGEVYIQIPPAGEGSGRVKVVVDTSQREFNAVQTGREPIASHTSVSVTDANTTTNTLTVESA